ncbi:MAG TPA: hypothetical protein VL992_01150 [Tepidisphaeraceae bacterium]|nr:hypothetical protein [Tepidisphaeraceae bacterium]
MSLWALGIFLLIPPAPAAAIAYYRFWQNQSGTTPPGAIWRKPLLATIIGSDLAFKAAMLIGITNGFGLRPLYPLSDFILSHLEIAFAIYVTIQMISCRMAPNVYYDFAAFRAGKPIPPGERNHASWYRLLALGAVWFLTIRMGNDSGMHYPRHYDDFASPVLFLFFVLVLTARWYLRVVPRNAGRFVRSLLQLLAIS